MRSKLIHVVLAGVTMVALGTYVERGSGSTIAPKNDAVAGAVERGAKWLVSVQLASNAFPSSSNSSTLSESARSMSRNPCRSPDWALERDPRTFSNAGASRWLFLRAGFLDARPVVPVIFLELIPPRFFVIGFFAAFFFGARPPAMTFLLEDRLDFVACLPFFFIAIHAV
jgi:hypothetical protein